jgi:hypothetical protein
MIRMELKYFDSMEISSAVADTARSFCVTDSYDPSLYSEDPNGYVAVIDDLTGRNIDAYTFPGSSQLTIDEPYKARIPEIWQGPCVLQRSKRSARHRLLEADCNGYRRARGFPPTP